MTAMTAMETTSAVSKPSDSFKADGVTIGASNGGGDDEGDGPNDCGGGGNTLGDADVAIDDDGGGDGDGDGDGGDSDGDGGDGDGAGGDGDGEGGGGDGNGGDSDDGAGVGSDAKGPEDGREEIVAGPDAVKAAWIRFTYCVGHSTTWYSSAGFPLVHPQARKSSQPERSSAPAGVVSGKVLQSQPSRTFEARVNQSPHVEDSAWVMNVPDAPQMLDAEADR